MYENYLAHYGVLGMRWGHRSASGASSHTIRSAKKDAKRYVDAKMFYGKTAGTKRKLLKAELDRKKKTIKGYEEEFNKAVESTDFSKSASKAVIKRKSIDATNRVRITTKKILNITGPLTVGLGLMYYNANKQKIDYVVMKQLNKVIKF